MPKCLVAEVSGNRAVTSLATAAGNYSADSILKKSQIHCIQINSQTVTSDATGNGVHERKCGMRSVTEPVLRHIQQALVGEDHVGV